MCERSGKNLFWSTLNLGDILDKLKTRDFNATSLSIYGFSTLHTTLPHNLIKDKLIGLIGKHPSIEKVFLTLNATTGTHFYFRKKLKKIMHGLVKMYVMC